MPRFPWSRPGRPTSLDSESDRIARYESIQRETCKTADAPFVPPDYSKAVWLGPAVAEGHPLVFGARYAETDGWSGWSLTADDRPKPLSSEIRFEHLRHLVSIREDLMPYLGLPVGWTFSILADGSWAAWSPKDRLLTWLDNFISGHEASSYEATAIAELIDEQFAGTELGTRVIEPLLRWAARDGVPPDQVIDILIWGRGWLMASTVR